MLKLILMRHGEAEPSRPPFDDKQRRLLPIGISAAYHCGQMMRARTYQPELILCSNAERAKATLDAVRRGASLENIETHILSQLYLADSETVTQICSQWADCPNKLLLIGHNPGWSDLATSLSGVPLNLGVAEAVVLEHPGHQWSSALDDKSCWTLVEHLH
ncbi:MAG: hypothetical protein NTX25_04200 [Proteobacteria bacterium]|nr:hypothetical protein [Pseudomonadota bacterium]